MSKFTITVSHLVEVDLDESKFTPDFMSEFRENFYPFLSIEDHANHIAQLKVRELLMPFIEGYGPALDFGIDAEIVDVSMDVLLKE